MDTSYFRRDTFRALAGKDADRFTDEEIDQAQREVVERVEAWARTAWPTVRIGTAAITAGDTTLTFDAPVFDTAEGAEEGRAVRVAGAGAAGAELASTIADITSATTAELAAPAGTTVAAAEVRWNENGDGTARAPRSRIDTYDGGTARLVLPRWPIIEVQTVTVDGEELEDTAFYRYLPTGEIRTALELATLPRGVEVTYTYGHEQTPASVRRAAIAATKSLLTSQAGYGGGIPEGVTAYTTEGTRFELEQSDHAEQDPWPWDPGASRALRSFWGPKRPKTLGKV